MAGNIVEGDSLYEYTLKVWNNNIFVKGSILKFTWMWNWEKEYISPIFHVKSEIFQKNLLPADQPYEWLISLNNCEKEQIGDLKRKILQSIWDYIEWRF